MQVAIHSVQRRRLYEDIVQQLHTLIRQGMLQHGARLPSERMLAERFNVSRSSVREAIRSLELQGLVVSRRGSGTFINTEAIETVVALLASTLTTGDETVKEIFEMRHLLEPQIAAVAATRADPDEVQRLADILEEQQEQLARGESGVDADTAFHFALASATHNSALVKVVRPRHGVLNTGSRAAHYSSAWSIATQPRGATSCRRLWSISLNRGRSACGTSRRGRGTGRSGPDAGPGRAPASSRHRRNDGCARIGTSAHQDAG